MQCFTCGVSMQQRSVDQRDTLCLRWHHRSCIRGAKSRRLRFSLRTIFVSMFIIGILVASARWSYVGVRPISWKEIGDSETSEIIEAVAHGRPVLLVVHETIGGMHRFALVDAAVDTPVVRRLVVSKGVIPLRLRTDVGFDRMTRIPGLRPQPMNDPSVVIFLAEGTGDPIVIRSLQDRDDRVVTALRSLP